LSAERVVGEKRVLILNHKRQAFISSRSSKTLKTEKIRIRREISSKGSGSLKRALNAGRPATGKRFKGASRGSPR